MPDEDQGQKPEQDSKRSALKGLAKAESMIQIALAVPAGCVVGLLIGAWLDRHYHQHWIAVLCMLLGAAGGFVQIFRVGLSGTGDGKTGDDDK
jgi:F0F1-type ATP synthase assembly protein I